MFAPCCVLRGRKVNDPNHFDDSNGHGEPMDDLTGFQRDILAVIADENGPCGADISHRLTGVYGDEHNLHSRLYMALDELRDEGHIADIETDEDERTRPLKLTDKGERKLRNDHRWRNTLFDT